MDLLLFACFTFMVMVSFKQEKIKDPLNDTITIKVKQANNKSCLERHHNHKDKTNNQQKIP
jgi:hypothetical protein